MIDIEKILDDKPIDVHRMFIFTQPKRHDLYLF